MIRLTRAERFQDARTVYNQHGRQSMDEVSAATGVTKAVIQALEDSESTRSVGCEKIAKLAKHYNVTTDYLLSLSDDPAPTRSAVDELGLPPEVIALIMNYKEAADTGVPNSLEGYILFMKIFGGSALFSLIHGLNEDLQFVSNGGELNLDMKQEFNNFSPSFKDFLIQSSLADELRATHPELVGRFIVVCGTDLLQYEMRKICDIFRMRLEEKLRYRAILGARLP